jgi:fused signal recognition particle receptor
MGFIDRIKSLFRAGAADEAFFDDLADILVEGDLGAELSYSIAEELRRRCRGKRIAEEPAVRAELKDILRSYGKEVELRPESGKMNIFLLLGVNGVGKTTSCAKLAAYYRRSGFSEGIVLAAGDTFRAAAVDQLKIHGQRLGLRVVAQAQGADPGAVLWDAIDAAKADGSGLVIADSAGRMHTRSDLVRELSKIDKIVSGRAAGANYRRLLVLDSTTGQNALEQARIFSGAVAIDAVILAKHDSSGKGGMALRLAKELGLPTAFVGTGEGYADIAPFRLDAFLEDFIGKAE